MNEADDRLRRTPLAVELTADLPFVAERAMWWPRPAGTWYEAHASLGSTETGTAWAIAGGRVSSGFFGTEQTYLLAANASPDPGRVRVTLVLDDGQRVAREWALGANARLTIDLLGQFPWPPELLPFVSPGLSFSALVESMGDAPVPITVEAARYSTPRFGPGDSRPLSAGAAMLATRIR